MTTTNIITPCDTCGEPATNMARDLKEVSEPTDSIERYEYTGGVKAGCDKHPVVSKEHHQNLVPDLWDKMAKEKEDESS